MEDATVTGNLGQPTPQGLADWLWASWFRSMHSHAVAGLRQEAARDFGALIPFVEQQLGEFWQTCELLELEGVASVHVLPTVQATPAGVRDGYFAQLRLQADLQPVQLPWRFA